MYPGVQSSSKTHPAVPRHETNAPTASHEPHRLQCRPSYAQNHLLGAATTVVQMEPHFAHMCPGLQISPRTHPAVPRHGTNVPTASHEPYWLQCTPSHAQNHLLGAATTVVQMEPHFAHMCPGLQISPKTHPAVPRPPGQCMYHPTGALQAPTSPCTDIRSGYFCYYTSDGYLQLRYF